MKLSIVLGVAAACLTVAAASAHSNSRVMIRHGGGSGINIDANEDGWVTRAEASSAFERIFGELDSNHDGRIDDEDHQEFNIDVDFDAPDVRVFTDGDGRRVRIINGDIDEATEARIEREIERAEQRAEIQIERAERDAERAEREVERAERDAERAEHEAERHVRVVERRREGDNEVIIIRRDGGSWTTLEGGVPPVPPVPAVAPVPPVLPLPPMPPMPFMMLIANSEEADLNGDDALSLDEFRNMQLRFFDASDANGDGRIRFEPPVPPTPPVAPTPPEPPRRR